MAHKGEKFYEGGWLLPKNVIRSKVKVKKRQRDEDDFQEDEGLSERKRVPCFREQTIFTLNSSIRQITDEQVQIKDALSSKNDLYIVKKDGLENDKHLLNGVASDDSGDWHKELCVDWSLKSQLKISSKNNFAWSSNHLKSSEESSGTSAFVRCIDLEPLSSQQTNPQIDSSLGAQFYQCCLYWQYPYIPSLPLFPRNSRSNSSLSFTSMFRTSSSSSFSSSPLPSSPSMRLDEKILDSIHAEWIESLHSSFQLLRVRQNPFFYVCSNTFTCLFCAAGIRNDQIQIYITQASKGFRDMLKKEGINFTVPSVSDENEDSQKLSQSQNSEEGSPKAGKEQTSFCFAECDNAEDFDTNLNEDADDEEVAEKWLEELGLSQDVTITSSFIGSQSGSSEHKPKLLVVSGSDALPFFNFLINTKSLLRSATGPLTGFPPTILSPVAFHGATLRALKVKQSKVLDKGEKYNLIELNGPVLPHMVHQLCSLLSKTVIDFKIHVDTVHSTSSLNKDGTSKNSLSKESQEMANAFELQNLSDCGLSKPLLWTFCKCSNCCTIKETISKKNGRYNWQ